MNARGTGLARAAAVGAALALVMGGSTIGAVAQEATPQPGTAEAVTTSEGTDTAPDAPLPVKDNTFSLGQSMQIRVNADAEPNSNLANFRWTVSQLTVQGPPDGSKDGTYDVPVPEGGSMPRYLTTFGRPQVDNGVAQFSVDVKNGSGTQRTVSLFPQDGEPPVALEARFTLNGEPISAKDLVGKSGVVTAQYTLYNRSAQPTEVTVTDLAGNPVTMTVDADVPMIGIAKTLLPQRYVGLNTGMGQFGADGRGNNQVQWIALPFKPLSKDGTATFGWSANVTDAVIPSILLQVAPLYLPAHEDDLSTPNVDESTGSGAPPVNLDPAMAEIQAGLASVVAGVETLTSGGGPDPLQALEEKLNTFFSEFGTNIQTIGSLLDPANPDGVFTAINEAQAALAQVIPLVETIDDIGTEALRKLSATLQDPTVRAVLQAVASTNPSSPVGSAKCAVYVAAVKEATGKDVACESLIEYSAGLLAVDPTNLTDLATFLDGANTVLLPVLRTLDSVLASLETTLTELSGQVQTIGQGIAASNVDLPALDAVISSVVASVLASPGGQQITGGLSQVGTGIGAAKQELANFVASAIVKAQGLAGQADAAVVELKSSVAGLKSAAARSPLVYGPLPEGTPPGTVLAGAYEFRIDAADTNVPYTPWRILLGVIFTLAAGFIGYWFLKKRSLAGGGPQHNVASSAAIADRDPQSA